MILPLGYEYFFSVKLDQLYRLSKLMINSSMSLPSPLWLVRIATYNTVSPLKVLCIGFTWYFDGIRIEFYYGTVSRMSCNKYPSFLNLDVSRAKTAETWPQYTFANLALHAADTNFSINSQASSEAIQDAFLRSSWLRLWFASHLQHMDVCGTKLYLSIRIFCLLFSSLLSWAQSFRLIIIYVP